MSHFVVLVYHLMPNCQPLHLSVQRLMDIECKALWVLLAGGVLETSSRGWKESLSASYSSSTSGNWSWDASDQSVPSTPSPPLSNDVNKSFLAYSQGEDNIEEAESTHFLFEDPIRRKRKVGMRSSPNWVVETKQGAFFHILFSTSKVATCNLFHG